MPGLLILDTNLLVLLTVGLTRRDYIAKHKRLDAYDEVDFDLVADKIEAFSGLLLVPNVVTETSNLLRQVGEPMRSQMATMLANLVAVSAERYVASKVAVARSDYVRLGVTDSVLLALAESGGTLFTADFNLYVAAAKASLPVINYNHMRAQRTDVR